MVRETHQPLSIKPQAIEPLVTWAVKMCQPDKTGAPAGTRLTLDLQGAFLPVVADRHFLQLALLNLVQNAVKYRRPDAAPHLIVTQERQESRDSLTAPRCVVRLRDNGIGIQKGDLRKVFEPFVRGSDRTKKDGYGLGLSLVAKVMTAMSGRVWAELPTDGRGTVMCLELPLAEAAPP
jgi:signal transduction histidine kinase